uniref:tRNA (34-2'-O)-methyltransferase regulator WDR6-like isoform X2 n=1 Tax=Pristiophorus japonicus TaxID=55135 RepID=UPI00398EC101
MQCESVSLLSPITALQFVGDFLLSGEGASINLYTLNSGNGYDRKLSCSVLRNYCVHGIKPCWSALAQTDVPLLAVFGGKGLIVLELNTSAGEPKLLEMGPLRELHDWIWDLQWLKGDCESAMYFGLALGHNSVVLCDYKAGRTLREVHCDVKCILYSACFVGRSWAELVLVSGTVFNQLVLWRMEGPTNEDGRVRADRRISGHSGVIFSIHYMEKNGLLASASDDRSVRLWKVGNLRQDLKGGDGGTGSAPCLLQLYGHQSRVWSVQLLDSHIVSVGEDSACIVWSYNGDIVDSFRGHRGRSVRAMAVNEDKGWVVTGGADSGIRLWRILEKKPQDVTVTQLKFDETGKVGKPKALALVDTALILVTTDAGSIYSYCLASGQWKLLLEDPSYQSYNVLAVTRLLNGCVVCVVGNIAGRVLIFPLHDPGERAEDWVHRGKVHSLGWACREGQSADKCGLFSSGADGVMVWREVSCVAGRPLSVAEKCRYLLPLCRHRWHTSVAFLAGGQLLVCGDRRGSVLLYSCAGRARDGRPLGADAESAAGNPGGGGPSGRLECREPVSALPGLHGKLGVTSVLLHGGSVYSTGRDGFYRQLEVEEGGRLRLLRSQRACRGMDWIERLVPTPGGKLLVLGFHATDFVVWDAETGETVLRVACGGGHRSWAYGGCPAGGLFAYLKAGAVVVCRENAASGWRTVVKEGVHGRELTCVRLVGRLAGPSARRPATILATGSEDTTLSVLAVDEGSGHVSKLATIGDHLSSVRTVAVARSRRPAGGDHDCSACSAVLFSAGGRAQLGCCRLLLAAGRTDGSAPATCRVEHLASHRLAEDWDRVKNRHRRLKMDPETRYMSIVLMDDGVDSGTGSNSSWHFLAAACSDGAVRLFVIDECQKIILLLAESFYHQRCVLKLETFTYQPATRGRKVFLCSAATDGRIAIWDISRTIERAKVTNILLERAHQPWELAAPRLVLKAHQCGVNGLHVRALDPGRYLLASGGDDNAIRVWVIYVWAAGDDDVAGSLEGNRCSDIRCTDTDTGDRSSDVRCTDTDTGDRSSDVRCTDTDTGDRSSDVRCTDTDTGDRSSDVRCTNAGDRSSDVRCTNAGDGSSDVLGSDVNGLCADDGAGVSVWAAAGPCTDSAHAAHVTGLRILSPSLLVSVSIDQRLTHWRLGAGGLHWLHSTWCQVADIAELESWEGAGPGTRLFAVCGHGLQILRSQELEQDHLAMQK